MAVGVGLTRICDSAGGVGSASLSVAISDDTPNFGDSVTITATASGLTPTSYGFYIPQRNGEYALVTQASDTYVWTVDVVGDVVIHVTATDGSDAVGGDVLVRASSIYLLDTYTTSNAAFSVRKLRSAYSGYCMTVRRSSDNATLNVGFVEDMLDVASILTFVGTGNGFVVTWYDQSTAASNATQATAANQPLIVSDGVLVSIDDVPALSCGVKAYVSNSFTVTNRTVVTAFCVARKTSNHISYVCLLGWLNDYTLQVGGGTDILYNETSGGTIHTTVNNYNNNQITALHGAAGAGKVRMNGVQVGTGTTAANSTLQRIGVQTFSTQRFMIGNIQEIIIFPDDQTANFSAIETNQINYFK